MSIAPPKPAPRVAAPSAIAQAARAFGDDYPPLRGQWRIRAAGLLLVLTTLLYAPWMLTSLNEDVPWLAWPFAAVNLFSLAYGVLAVVNAWSRAVPPPRPLTHGDEPHVAVIVPTWGAGKNAVTSRQPLIGRNVRARAAHALAAATRRGQ